MKMNDDFKKKVGLALLIYIFVSGGFMIYYVLSPCKKWDVNPCQKCWDDNLKCEVVCHYPYQLNNGLDTDTIFNNENS